MCVSWNPHYPDQYRIVLFFKLLEFLWIQHTLEFQINEGCVKCNKRGVKKSSKAVCFWQKMLTVSVFFTMLRISMWGIRTELFWYEQHILQPGAQYPIPINM